jgi:hypothetical protein
LNLVAKGKAMQEKIDGDGARRSGGIVEGDNSGGERSNEHCRMYAYICDLYKSRKKGTSKAS